MDANTRVKKIPRFERQNRRLKKRVGSSWRKPRGIDNKQRVQRKGFMPLPKIGYRQPRGERGKHPSGAREVLVRSLGELATAGKQVVVRIASNLGGRKRKLVLEQAKKMGLAVVNS